MRTTSAVSQVMTYATFLSLSLAIHMVVILGSRSRPRPAPPAPELEVVAAAQSDVRPGWRRGGLE